MCVPPSGGKSTASLALSMIRWTARPQQPLLGARGPGARRPYFADCCRLPIDWGSIETCELTKGNLQALLVSDFRGLEDDLS